MKFNDRDKFETSGKNLVENSNFFLQEGSSYFDTTSETADLGVRLNNYDSVILENDAYKDIEDEAFKIEYKINLIEKEIEQISSQLNSAEEIGDIELIANLIKRKKTLVQKYNEYTAQYRQRGLSAKISGKLFNKIPQKKSLINEYLSTINEFVLSKLPKSLTSIIELKRSLDKLESLNNSVDELIRLNTPYGENAGKYEQLSKYIIKANSIQAEISKNFGQNKK